MIDMKNVFIWNWDARPWPDFPARSNIWSDAANHRLGHWITGRLGAASLADTVAELCRRSGLTEFDVSALFGSVQGYLLDEAGSARSALQTLMMVYSFDAVESGGVVRFLHRDRPSDLEIAPEDALLGEAGSYAVSKTRSSAGDIASAVTFGFINSENDYEAGAAEARSANPRSVRVESNSAPLLLDPYSASDVAKRFLAEVAAGRETVEFSCRRNRLDLEAGDIVSLNPGNGTARYRIDRIDDAGARKLTLTRTERAAIPFQGDAAPESAPPAANVARPVLSRYLDLPAIPGRIEGPAIAAFSEPWQGEVSVFAELGPDDFRTVAEITRPAVIGELTSPLAPGAPDRWTNGGFADLRLYGGALSSSAEISVLNGQNLAALLFPDGMREVIQFQNAELTGENSWRLSRILRGQAGTDDAAMLTAPAGTGFVLLDSAVSAISDEAGFRGVTRDFRIGPSRKPVSDDTYQAFTATDSGLRFRPWSPVHLRARTLWPDGDIEITWVGRASSGADNWDAPDPAADGLARYLLRIGDHVEEVTTTGRWIWSASDQSAAGAAGAIEISVSQLSDQYGESPRRRIFIHV